MCFYDYLSLVFIYRNSSAILIVSDHRREEITDMSIVMLAQIQKGHPVVQRVPLYPCKI